VQAAAAHCVPLTYDRQPPLPSHVPSVPQLAAPWSLHWFSGSWPAGTVEQVPPVPVSAHDMQLPAHAVLQQTPCAQKPLLHSGPAAQAAPSGLRPQLDAVQTLPVVQSALVEQLAWQLPPLQRYGMHDCDAPGMQLPTPSHRPASVSVEPVHDCMPQARPGAYRRQAPAPLHEPSVPQLDAPESAHWFSGSLSAGMAVQTPLLAASAHDVQMPVQAPAQQTPCWHEPDAHSLAAAQSAPFTFLPQIVPLQTLPFEQSALVAHAVLQEPVVPHA
jgi:hypothetical protein